MDVIIFALLAAGFKGGQEDAELAKSRLSFFVFFFNSSVCTLERDAVAKKDNDTSFIIIKANEEEEEKKNSFFFFLVFLKEPTPLIDAKRIARFFARKVGLNKKLIQKLAIFFHLS